MRSSIYFIFLTFPIYLIQLNLILNLEKHVGSIGLCRGNLLFPSYRPLLFLEQESFHRERSPLYFHLQEQNVDSRYDIPRHGPCHLHLSAFCSRPIHQRCALLRHYNCINSLRQNRSERTTQPTALFTAFIYSDRCYAHAHIQYEVNQDPGFRVPPGHVRATTRYYFPSKLRCTISLNSLSLLHSGPQYK